MSQCWHLCKSCWSGVVRAGVGVLGWLLLTLAVRVLTLFSKLRPGTGLQLPWPDMGESFRGGEVCTPFEQTGMCSLVTCCMRMGFSSVKDSLSGDAGG